MASEEKVDNDDKKPKEKKQKDKNIRSRSADRSGSHSPHQRISRSNSRSRSKSRSRSRSRDRHRRKEKTDIRDRDRSRSKDNENVADDAVSKARRKKGSLLSPSEIAAIRERERAQMNQDIDDLDIEDILNPKQNDNKNRNEEPVRLRGPGKRRTVINDDNESKSSSDEENNMSNLRNSREMRRLMRLSNHKYIIFFFCFSYAATFHTNL